MIELVVNADDFGHSVATNDGIIHAREHGIVTSTSLMVRRPGAEHAARYARANPDFGVGLHIDFGPWESRDDEGRLVVRGAPVAEEPDAQLERFRELVGREPTHVDSHHHVHRDEPVGPEVRALAARLGVPLRFYGPARYVGEFYGAPEPAAIELPALLSIVETLEDGHHRARVPPRTRRRAWLELPLGAAARSRGAVRPACGGRAGARGGETA